MDQINNECLTEIFHRVDRKSLIRCMQVCHRFNNLMSADHFWIGYARENQMTDVLPPEKWRKAAAQKKFEVKDSAEVDTSSFNFDYKKMVLSGCGYSTFNPLEKIFDYFEKVPEKILRESFECGQFSIQPAGDGIQMENDGIGCDKDPSVPRCLAFSYETCKITVRIDLNKLGIDTWILDHADVGIDLSQKIGHRRDCGATTTMEVELTGKTRQAVSMTCGSRQKAKFTPCRIQFGLQSNNLVNVTLSGKDTQFWAGYYGPKFGPMQVRIVLPDEPIVKSPKPPA